MATSSGDNPSANDRYRSTAMKHAYNLEHQKSMRNNVLDLIVDVVDLPSKPDSDPAHPLASDAALFKRGLHLFQPSDFDDVVLERNIYDKCGYGLCPRPNLKVGGSSQNRIIWGKRSGPAFTIVPKADLEKWCSKECEERALFVRIQLGKEPAWLREEPVGDIKLLDESRQGNIAADLANSMGALHIDSTMSAVPDIANDLHKLALERSGKHSEHDQAAERLKVLSLERGEQYDCPRVEAGIEIMEKGNTQTTSQPPQLTHRDAGAVEGYRPRKVRFAGESDSDQESGGIDIDLENDEQSEEEGDAMSL
jgi:RNA polymerase II-associated protein 2